MKNNQEHPKGGYGFKLDQHVVGRPGTSWEGEKGKVIFYHYGNLEIILDEDDEEVAVPEADFIGVDKITAMPAPRGEYVHEVERALRLGIKHNKSSISRLAKQYSITDQTDIKELTELAIVNVARELAHSEGSTDEKYQKIVALYESQVTLSHRTSMSMLLQQYSTPAPIAYLMGLYCGLDRIEQSGGYAWEPSAGNGLLTIAANPERVYVNEIDPIRLSNLKTQGFKNVFNRDSSDNFSIIDLDKTFQAVVTNPPFGRSDEELFVSGFKFTQQDHIMAVVALKTMISDGKAAIIIGGHTRWDHRSRIKAGRDRIFFNYLHHFYNVEDVIPIEGKKLYTRQGTGFPTRLILIDGRKSEPSGAAPLKNTLHSTVVSDFAALYSRVMRLLDEHENRSENRKVITVMNQQKTLSQLEFEAHKLMEELGDEDLGMPYLPASQACVVLNTQVPDSMGYETHNALARIKEEVGGDIDNFVRHRLGYQYRSQLCEALSAEQIDAVAMAIYNIEAKAQGMIIGDQTGIGKGRIAAAMIRYGVERGLNPIFITEKANLFSDIYRDLSAIGSAQLKPFIINGKESKTDIKDEDGNIIYQALSAPQQETIFKSGTVPIGFDFVVGTYSQVSSPEKKPLKPDYLRAIASGNLLIMDEAHNSSGASNTGVFMQGLVKDTIGVVFLSATFAKRPDNMPIYAMKTAMSDANMTKEELVEAITKGGVALQEILSSQLVAEGQMIRRERSFEGVEVNYIQLDGLEAEHRAISDNITFILRDIIAFQNQYVDRKVQELDEVAAAEGKETSVREGTSQAGVDNQPYFSKVFNVINQMLFSIKAEAVAERAIERLREGKKPVIAFASTMGSFIEQMENDSGLPVSDGDTINMDFSEVLRKGLVGVLRYTEKNTNGQSIYKSFEITELGPEAMTEYARILDRINSVSTGISISPIDMVIQKLEKAGYSVAEVTGRKFSVRPNWKGSKGLVQARKKINTNDAFRKFNNNEIDVLMINQSGSTGASAHAIVTAKVPASQVKQRVMIVLQAELDINTEVQKRGRINRTGQILKPIYDYVISAIPAEKRLMMMLQKKLKSLDANTTSNQKQSNKILDVPDFLNKYGDKVVKEYLMENKEINTLLGDPLSLSSNGIKENIEDAAHRVSGRVAVLSTQMQTDFYNQITERYNDLVEYLKQTGDYDLEVEALDLKAETISRTILKVGKGGESVFGEDSILEKVHANVLTKPFSVTELNNLIADALDGRAAQTISAEQIKTASEFFAQRQLRQMVETTDKFTALKMQVGKEKKMLRILEKEGQEAYHKAVKEKEIETALAKQLEMLQIASRNAVHYLTSVLDFFYVGRKLVYPVVTFDNGQELLLAVSLGVTIDKRKDNPYAPSAVKVKIAIASGNKFVAIPLSFYDGISRVMAASMDIDPVSTEELLEQWENQIKESSKDRTIRYIITGNLLQAFGSQSGKLVSYTTQDGKTLKGILTPQEWQPEEAGQQMVTVPILKALPILKSMTAGGGLQASSDISFFRSGDNYRVIMPASRAKAGDIYMDQALWPLIEKNRFEKIADRMQGILPASNMDAFAQVLQSNHSISVRIGQHLLSLIVDNAPKEKHRQRITLPPPAPEEPQRGDNIYNILELEAEALLLELELAA